MKKLLAVLCLMSAWALAKPPPKAKAPPADAPMAQPAPLSAEDRKKVLYALGVMVAQRTPLGQAGLDEAEMAEVLAGFSDSALGKELKFQPAEHMSKVDQFLKERQKIRAEQEKQKGQKYLEEQAALQGAQKLPSGLIYFETQAGSGESPMASDTVKVHYRGTLTNGTEFDSSFKRGTPAEFPLNGVIKCWTEGVAKMKVGGKARLVCPPEIAYGERGMGGSIPPNSALNFEVELISIAPKAATEAKP